MKTFLCLYLMVVTTLAVQNNGDETDGVAVDNMTNASNRKRRIQFLKLKQPPRKREAVNLYEEQYKDLTKKKSMLWVVGIYLAAFKYYGVDVTNMLGNRRYEEDRQFFRRFPKIKQLHPALHPSCKTAHSCLTHIFNVAKQSVVMEDIFQGSRGVKPKPRNASLNKDVITSNMEPSIEETFRFRTTAMYYMCYHALNRHKDLYFANFAESRDCFRGLKEIYDRHWKRFNFQEVEDIRSVFLGFHEMYEYSGFVYDVHECARLWFCPNPCFGRKSYGVYNMTMFKHKELDPGNPCRDLNDNNCTWDNNKNRNFNDLIRNRFNISCNCSADRKGFEYSSKYDRCIDIDECYEGKYKCPGARSVCRNTIGGYTCTCRRGFRYSQKKDECIRGALLKPMSVLNDPPRRKKFGPQGELSFWESFKIWLGL